MTIFISIFIIVICVGLMSLGIIFHNKPIKKTCSPGSNCECKKQGKDSSDSGCQ